MEVIRNPRRLVQSILDQAYELSKKLRHVNDIMSQNVVTTTPSITMDEAAKTMGERRIGSLIVLRDNKPVGIVTERDLLSHVLALGLDPRTVKVESAMSSPLISIHPSATIKEAAQKMMKTKGRIPVFENGRLVGIVTASDLLKSMPKVSETMLWVNEFMTERVITADETTLVSSIVKVMGEKKIGSVVITREGGPIGIFTERDLLTQFLAKGRSLMIRVGVACSSPLLVIPSRITVHEAAFLMASRRIKRLPVVEDNYLIGIITARDLVEAYTR
jgi:CBS domain-containing protein